MTRPRARRQNRADAAVELRHLWAPWRAQYVHKAAPASKKCIFCFGSLTAAERRRNLVLYAGSAALVMLNRYPYNNGHLLVAPRRHAASPELLTAAERGGIGEVLNASLGLLRSALKPAAFNLGANLGRAAGAGIADHFHWHIVPRWKGDTNFMTVNASTRVVSEHLAASFKRLNPLFKTLDAALS
ncbi:MAG TPA: HIT domain-containing protein [Candidatus Binataceae bacterium]|nr:HIT domain-containing protein [Candidatus Binataceae bacterium]